MKKTTQINLATLYAGRTRHAIDGSNRIMLPAEWRGDGCPSQFFIVVSAGEDCLVVCSPAVFEAWLEELRDGLADKTLIPELERELNDRVRQVSLDRFGRLPLPPDLMARVGIAKQGNLVGRFSKFEVWACDRCEQPSPEKQQVREHLTRKLSAL